MTLQRREFLRVLAASSAAALLQPEIKSMAADTDNRNALVIDARGRLHAPALSPLHLGGTRVTARGQETLRLMNFCWERRLREKATGQESIHRVLPVSGEFHFARCNPDFWEDGLSKMKACGLTTVATYLFWILHEPEEGRFEWRNRRDLRRFLDLCAKQDLEVFLRVGPFAHGEMRNGGLPDWLYGKPFQVRSNDPAYLDYVRRFYVEIGHQIRGYGWLDGGPIVAIQIENEFMAATAPWEVVHSYEQLLEWIPSGSGGIEHMMALKKIAVESGLAAPVYAATAWGSPIPPLEFQPMYGGYGFEPWSIDVQTHKQKPTWTFLFRAAQAKLLPDGKQSGGSGAGQIPYACCELGGGMQCFYHDRFVVPPESVQATAVTALGSGCSFLGYYVFHGGSNPSGERVFYGEYDVPRISYDFQAPIREYGQIADSYRDLRLIHLFLASWGDRLAAMQTVLPAGAETLAPESSTSIRCALRSDGQESFLFVNNYQDHVPLPARQSLRFCIQLDRGQTGFPSAAGLSIASGESAIFPVGLHLGKLNVAWSTAQLLTEITYAGARHVFLFAPRGSTPEIALGLDGLMECKVEGAALERNRQHDIIRGSSDKPLHVRCKAGDETILLHVLPRRQALRLSRHRLWGEERIVLSDADVAEQNGQLLLWSHTEQVEALIFPPPAGLPVSDNIVMLGASRLSVSRRPWQGGVTFDRLTESTMRIHIGARAFEGVNNILLRIEYVGDIGQAFYRDKLIADNFANGAPWEIGLRQLQLGNEDSEIILKVVPRNQDSPVYLDETVPRPERFAGSHVAAIDSVEAIPVYRFQFEKPEAA